MTPAQLEPFKEELSVVPKFQWVKSDKAGTISYYKDVVFFNSMILVEFTDGSRVNYDMLGDVVMKVMNDSDLLEVSNDTHTAIEMGGGSPKVNIHKGQATKTQPKESPIQNLLKKQKQNPVCIDISIELNVPSPELYKVICSSFDNAEDEIVEFIVADLDLPLIKAAVQDAVKKYYSE